MRRKLMMAAAVAGVFTLCGAQARAQQQDASGPRQTPPTVRAVSPMGVSRGTTAEMTVEGFNLAKASAIYFNRPGVTAKILGIKELPDVAETRLGSNGTRSTVDVGPLPPRNELRLQLEIAPSAPVGPVAFRVQTPLGTSPEGRFLIEPYYGEMQDREPNDTPEDAVEVYLPAILAGTIGKQGDVDYYKIHVHAGEHLVFEDGAMAVGSALQPVVTILREDQSVVREFGRDGMQQVASFDCTFDKEGTYYVKIEDFAKNGSAAHFYRFKVGDYSLATMAFPLGFRRGEPTAERVTGYNVKSAPVTPDLKKVSEIWPASDDVYDFRPRGAKGISFWDVKLGVGDDPEVTSKGANRALETAMPVTLPVTVNAILDGPKQAGDLSHYYKFHAAQGEQVVLEIEARRLGSDLDSDVQVLDAKGNRFEMATVRSLLATSTALRDHRSTDRGIRLSSVSGLAAGDYLMIGSEIDRIESMPRSPDDDAIMENFGGQRITYFGTTPEAHALDEPVYKVELFPPGRRFSPNGLPVAHLYFENDDGGPGFDKDSYLRFTAPAAGDYFVRVSDTRGESGPRFPYRLNLRPPRPDFRLSALPANPNVPRGGSIPLTVTARRIDNFEGPIHVTVAGLPAGLHSTAGTIAWGEDSVTLLLSADEHASLAGAAPLKIEGRAEAGTRVLTHWANPDDALALVSLMPEADIRLRAMTRVVELEPGGSAQIEVALDRQNGYRGRVPVTVRNLPETVRVLDVGLNGVLIAETENKRTFTLRALPNAQPLEQVIYVSGDVETRSPLQNSFAAAEPILLRVKAKSAQLAAR